MSPTDIEPVLDALVKARPFAGLDAIIFPEEQPRVTPHRPILNPRDFGPVVRGTVEDARY
jgi:hypothetical protein